MRGRVPAPFPGLGGDWGPPHWLALVFKSSSTPGNFAASENLGRGPAGRFPVRAEAGWSLNGGVSLRGPALGRPPFPGLQAQPQDRHMPL